MSIMDDKKEYLKIRDHVKSQFTDSNKTNDLFERFFQTMEDMTMDVDIQTKLYMVRLGRVYLSILMFREYNPEGLNGEWRDFANATGLNYTDDFLDFVMETEVNDNCV